MGAFGGSKSIIFGIDFGMIFACRSKSGRRAPKSDPRAPRSSLRPKSGPRESKNGARAAQERPRAAKSNPRAAKCHQRAEEKKFTIVIIYIIYSPKDLFKK